MDDATLGQVMGFLRDTVVAITHGGSKGTGFFVAPNVVLTCAHVLEASSDPIKVRWKGDSKTAKVNRIGNEDSLDLAVLFVEPGWASPSVLLGVDVALNCSFYAFGYPDGEYREGGDSATFVYEGPSSPGQPEELYKFKEGEAPSGMSGSPMLNQQTGSVTAVVSINRRRDTDLGARGVPIHLLRDFYPSLLTQNPERQANPDWKSCVARFAAAASGSVSAGSTAPNEARTSLPSDSARKAALDKTLQQSLEKNRSIEVQKSLAARQKRHQSDVDRYGFCANELSVEMVLNDDGSSSMHYRIEGLSVCRDRLLGLRFVFESTGGCVGFPEMDSDTREQQIEWQPHSEPRRKRMPILEKLESVRIVEGLFLFGPEGLRPEDGAISFGWHFNVLNGDALSDWEFYHLYPDPKLQVHVNEQHLSSPMEYFARLVWFPTHSLKVRLALPPRICEAPRLSVFRCAEQVNVPASEVVKQEIAQLYPDNDSPWVKANVKWQRDRFAERLEAPGLIRTDKDRVFEFTASQPPVGWSYSLDWLLPEQQLGSNFEELISRAEDVRGKLIEYSAHCKVGALAGFDCKMRELVEEFSHESRQKYHGKNAEGSFGVSVMTYDRNLRRLVVVDGYRDNVVYTSEEREFWLPFGLGLAGACFRSGGEALFYVKPDLAPEIADKAEYFLSVTDTSESEVLIALPVDHSDFNEDTYKITASERCRQLVAVVTLSSTKRSSGLSRLRFNPDEVVGLRNRCQRLGDDITALIQPHT